MEGIGENQGGNKPPGSHPPGPLPRTLVQPTVVEEKKLIMESVEPVKVAQQAPVKIQAPQPQPQVSKVAAKAAVEQVIRRKGQPKRGASGAYRSSK